MSGPEYWLLGERGPTPPGLVTARRGIVRASGRAVCDDDGFFHPLGLTFFWSLFGCKFEKDRWLEHLAWIAPYKFDYLRKLCEVDWAGRTITPDWDDYQKVLAEDIDTTYAHGMRSQLTLIGGREGDRLGMLVARLVTEVVKDGRQHKVMHYEVVNERTRLNKMSAAKCIEIGRYLRLETPHLVGLSDKATDAELQAALSTLSITHTRRSDHDHYWSHVRQGYDFKNTSLVASNNEPQGPQSSVEELSNPMQLAAARELTAQCGGAFYVLHVAQGVTGKAEPNYGRPENMWEVPNIDVIMKSVRNVDALLPEGIENWRTVNNGSQHPLPLDPRLGYGFWEGNTGGSVNKNYAALSGNRFVISLLGVQEPPAGGPTLIGTARRACRVKAYDVGTKLVVEERSLSANEKWFLQGRRDTMTGYIIHGEIL